MLRFLVFGVGRTCAGLVRVGVHTCVLEGGDVVVHLSAWMDSSFLLHGSLSMVAALCGLGAN